MLRHEASWHFDEAVRYFGFWPVVTRTVCSTFIARVQYPGRVSVLPEEPQIARDIASIISGSSCDRREHERAQQEGGRYTELLALRSLIKDVRDAETAPHIRQKAELTRAGRIAGRTYEIP